jgi:sporadic carbohydrate cluster protein (TIGR04323 family)
MSLQNWQNCTLDYNLEKYPWPSWILNVIQEIEPAVKSLANFHLVVPSSRIVDVTNHVQASFSRPEFMQRFDDFAEDYGRSLIDNKNYMIKRQATLNLVVPNQQKLGRLLPFHQGVWYSNGRGQRTLWLALTPCFDTNSMWVVDHESSRKISLETIHGQWDQTQFELECKKHAWPVNILPGQCHLFHQEIIHGNVNNDTDVTRMSIDWHLLVEHEEHGRRLPGGFFRFPGDHQQAQEYKDMPRSGFVQYVGNNTEYDRGIPIVLQRMLMTQYCENCNIKTQFTQFENEYLSWMPILEQVIRDGVPGIVMGSIYSLPDDATRCRRLLQLAIDSGVTMHFANEYLRLENMQDLELIEKYRAFARHKVDAHFWEVSV